MPEVGVSAGTIQYEDTGGDDPVLVFLHGVLMDGTLWRHVVADLKSDYRCIVPILPLGGHHQPMLPDADLSILAQVRLVSEFLDALTLEKVTLLGSDWGGAQLLVSEGLDKRVARLILTSCEAFDNYPPGIPGRLLCLLARVPAGLAITGQVLRVGPLRRLPITFGRMSKRPVPKEIIKGWLRPLRKREIRRDLRKYLTQVPSKTELLEWADRQRNFSGPVLVAWASEDRLMPPEHGKRLAQLFPNAHLVEIADSYTLIPEDQPALLAKYIREFLADTVSSA
jgi:pimeloyl-ACP methyl ester carboxylesterase